MLTGSNGSCPKGGELYYRYEDEVWKRAFREVFYYISEKIQEDRTPTVHKNLHRREHLKGSLILLKKPWV